MAAAARVVKVTRAALPVNPVQVASLVEPRYHNLLKTSPSEPIIPDESI